MPYLFVSAAHKSSGKTTASIGLCRALQARGLVVQPFKKGPDYIDPMWLAQATGRSCYNLDFYTMGAEEIDECFRTRMRGAEIGLVEGNKGLFDGLDLDGSNSNAALAQQLDAPVILVIDARGMTRGIAPLILGYQAFEPEVRIAGVILNQLGGSRHESKLRAVIQHYTDIPVLGALHHHPDLEIVERHLGLTPSNEAARVDRRIQSIGHTVAEHVDLDALLNIAETAPDLAPILPGPSRTALRPDVRIGIARDTAFGFYYPGDLEAMVAAGAELIPFNALKDQRLPPVDGLFIGGGFPETQMDALEENTALRVAIRAAIEADLPVYAECGGLMYLARKITWKGKTREMVGALPADVVMHERPQGRGYVRLRETARAPWPRGAHVVDEIKAHEFHYSAIENLDQDIDFAYEVLRGAGLDGRHDGLVYRNVLASYTHLRDVKGNHWVSRFVAHVRACKRAREALADAG